MVNDLCAVEDVLKPSGSLLAIDLSKAMILGKNLLVINMCFLLGEVSAPSWSMG